MLGLTDTVQSSIVNLAPSELVDTFANASESNPVLWRVAGVLMLLTTLFYYVRAPRRIQAAQRLVGHYEM